MFLTHILAYIQSLYTQLVSERNYQTELEQFISSKHPQTVSDVEHWTKQYDKRLSSWGKLQ